MGTRNLTMVIHKEETKIAQYGQWDGYPEGNGVKILNFVRKKQNLRNLQAKLTNVRFSTEKDEKKVDKFLKSIGCKDGWMNMDQADLYHKQYPYLSRDIGAGILELVANSTDKKIVLVDSTSFAGDSLFCEWAYVIDLDRNELRAYTGFNKSPLQESPDEMFAHIKSTGEYGAIRFLKKYDLNALPTKRKFISELKRREKEVVEV